MNSDLLCKNVAQPDFNTKRKTFFITSSITPLRSRPTTTQSTRSANSASRVFSARRSSIFEQEGRYEQRKIQSRREARQPHDEYDKGTLEQLMRKRACIGVLPQRNVMPKSFNPQYNGDILFKDHISFGRNQTGQRIVNSQRRNICDNVTQPQERMLTVNQQYQSIFTGIMEAYDNDLAVRLRDFYMQGLGHSPQYIQNGAKSDTQLSQMYHQPQYSVFTGNSKANDVKLRSALYEDERANRPHRNVHDARGLMMLKHQKK